MLRNRRTAYYLALVVATTALFTVTYNAGMAVLEGREQPLYRSLEVVIQSFTTTGYGEDAPWKTPEMNALVITMQLAGIGLILTAVDVFAVPWLRDAIEPTAPDSVADVTDHVVICGYTPRTDAFIDDLVARGREYVLVAADADMAADCHQEGYRVVHGDPESVETLRAARLDTAAALVVDAGDDAGASIVLSAVDTSPDVYVVTLVEDAALARYHRIAGADDVLSPRQLLGESLAERAPAAVTADVDEGVAIGEDFELVELAVTEGGSLQGRTFADATLRERFGVNVIGAWFDGEFETPVPLDAELAAGTQLLVTGESAQVDALRDETAGAVRAFPGQRIIVAGYGDSGRAAHGALDHPDSRVTVLDTADADGVDVVGDAREPDTLAAAGIDGASTLLLTLGDDTTAIIATLIARDLNPDLRIAVRANREENVEKLYRAGADYVQSLATVSGRMLTSTVIEDEEVLAYDRRVRIARLPATGLQGETLVDAAVRTETGATVVAVVRGGETITDFDAASFTFDADDEVIVAGTDAAVTAFESQFAG
jgi:Trk K+ transport system NAD-binding subunit